MEYLFAALSQEGRSGDSMVCGRKVTRAHAVLLIFEIDAHVLTC